MTTNSDDKLAYRVWPDGTVQATEDGGPYAWMSDDFMLIRASDENEALALAGVSYTAGLMGGVRNPLGYLDISEARIAFAARQGHQPEPLAEG